MRETSINMIECTMPSKFHIIVLDMLSLLLTCTQCITLIW